MGNIYRFCCGHMGSISLLIALGNSPLQPRPTRKVLQVLRLIKHLVLSAFVVGVLDASNTQLLAVKYTTINSPSLHALRPSAVALEYLLCAQQK
jgi:hypothetical protein